MDAAYITHILVTSETASLSPESSFLVGHTYVYCLVLKTEM